MSDAALAAAFAASAQGVVPATPASAPTRRAAKGTKSRSATPGESKRGNRLGQPLPGTGDTASGRLNAPSPSAETRRGVVAGASAGGRTRAAPGKLAVPPSPRQDGRSEVLSSPSSPRQRCESADWHSARGSPCSSPPRSLAPSPSPAPRRQGGHGEPREGSPSSSPLRSAAPTPPSAPRPQGGHGGGVGVVNRDGSPSAFGATEYRPPASWEEPEQAAPALQGYAARRQAAIAAQRYRESISYVKRREAAAKAVAALATTDGKDPMNLSYAEYRKSLSYAARRGTMQHYGEVKDTVVERGRTPTASTSPAPGGGVHRRANPSPQYGHAD